MTVVARPPTRAGSLGRVRHRKNVSQLTAAELEALRAAWKALVAIPDDRGYQYFAGWHGVPFGWCGRHDNDPLFLPWHRAYLYHLELALLDQDPTVALPWWDWMNEPGIPAAYGQRRPGGKTNPLYSAPIRPYMASPQAGWPKVTRRTTGANPQALPPPLRSRGEWLMEPTSYTEFNRRVTLLHNNMHGWVGGTMGEVDWAAYDPIFWAHHAMVDRLWRIWQHRNPGALPPADVLDTPLQLGKRPILTVRETIDVKRLGYDYVGVAASVRGSR